MYATQVHVAKGNSDTVKERSYFSHPLPCLIGVDIVDMAVKTCILSNRPMNPHEEAAGWDDLLRILNEDTGRCNDRQQRADKVNNENERNRKRRR